MALHAGARAVKCIDTATQFARDGSALWRDADMLDRRRLLTLPLAASLGSSNPIAQARTDLDPAPSQAHTALPSGRLPIGMNLAPISDYSLGFPFKNLLWGARPWMTRHLDQSGSFDSGQIDAVPLDANGYPLELPVAVAGVAQPQAVHTILPNVTESGRHVLLYDGEGEIRATLNTRVISAAPGRVVLLLIHNGEDEKRQGFAITRSVAGNHVRNIRVLAERDAQADLALNPFRDDFLAYCRQWHALRFMDWQATNESLEHTWQGRKQRSFYTMVGRGGDAIGRWGTLPTAFIQRFSGGVSLDVIIELANLTETDPWVNVPHRATPEYMHQMAMLFKTGLDPRRKVYVEYSNEVWNRGFLQSSWALQCKVAADIVQAAGGQAWQGGIEPILPYDGGTVALLGGTQHPERAAALARRCLAVWEDVFAGKHRTRLVRVLGVQHANAAAQHRMAAWVSRHGGADVLAAGGYFGPDDQVHDRWEKAGAALTADQVVHDTSDAWERNSRIWTERTAATAAHFGLGFMVYEGGQGIEPRRHADGPHLPALKAAQYHPGLYDISMRNLRLHARLGCRLFMAYYSIGRQGTRSGSWGHQERYGQPASEIPKFGALLDCNLPREHSPRPLGDQTVAPVAGEAQSTE